MEVVHVAGFTLDTRDMSPELEYHFRRCRCVRTEDRGRRELRTHRRPFHCRTQQFVDVEPIRMFDPRDYLSHCTDAKVRGLHIGRRNWQVAHSTIGVEECGPGPYRVTHSRWHLEVSTRLKTRSNRVIPLCGLAPSRSQRPNT